MREVEDIGEKNVGKKKRIKKWLNIDKCIDKKNRMEFNYKGKKSKNGIKWN